MSISRRGFLEDLLAAGVLAGAVTSIEATEPLRGDASLDAFNDQTKDDVHDFWQRYFDAATKRGRGPVGKLEAEDRKAQYLHVSETAGIRYLNDIKSDELLDYDGDVLINAHLGQFRPGTEDRERLANVKSSALRIDFMQDRGFMNILAPMAWAALAVYEHDHPNRLPTLSQLGYQKFLEGQVLLTGGRAKFGINVHPVKPESTLHKILRTLTQAAIIAAPVLSLPAITMPVLRTVTEMYLDPKGQETHGTPLLNSMPRTWCATQQGFEEADDPDKLPLLDGMYLMIPQAHAAEFGAAGQTLKMQGTQLVSKTASLSDSPDQRALDAIPGVTYVTMSLKISKLPPNVPSQKTAGQEQQTVTSAPPPKPAAGGGGGTGRPRPTPTPVKKPEDL